MRWLILTALTASGCSAASLVLKTPIVGECERAGLRGCEAMTEGILLVIEGEKREGLKKVAAGAGANGPDELKKFLSGLKALRTIPGADEYMRPVWDVIDYLEKDMPKSEPRTAVAIVAPSAPSPTIVVPDHIITADTDAKQLAGGAIVPAIYGTKRRKCHGPAGAPSTCAYALIGPVVVTSLLRTAESCQGVFVGTVDPVADDGAFDWQLAVEREIAGRIFVPHGKQLVVGAARGDNACGIVWSGFRPYAERAE